MEQISGSITLDIGGGNPQDLVNNAVFIDAVKGAIATTAGANESQVDLTLSISRRLSANLVRRLSGNLVAEHTISVEPGQNVSAADMASSISGANTTEFSTDITSQLSGNPDFAAYTFAVSSISAQVEVVTTTIPVVTTTTLALATTTTPAGPTTTPRGDLNGSFRGYLAVSSMLLVMAVSLTQLVLA